ncbi:TetR/AcrR family transcriptional regulator [Phenylobacterium sp. LjRoot225]|uniref:TetR/AcrR family transcriptional regulator n=1 Tax=Phenylobacterium sp. LjRoot225 TaxID=3342285 RepID=UPI003ED144B9
MPENTRAAIEIEPRRARGRPKAEDLAELEDRLIRVARQKFVVNGYGATSMNEVAKAARISKGTLWARFPSKADLFRAIIDQQIQQTGDGGRHLGPRPKTLEAMLRGFAERALQDSLSVEIVQLNRLIYSEAGRFPELGEAAWARSRAGVQQVTDFIQDYAAKEGITCRDPEAAAEMFTTLLRGFYGDVMLKGHVATAAEIKAWTRRMVKVFLAGRPGW